MKSYTYIGLLIFGFVLSIGGAGAPARADSQPEYQTVAAIDAIARETRERSHIAGLSIAVAKGSEIIHARGYGYANLEHMVPVTPKVVFRIGSVTKQFTAAAILQLVEKGKLSLDDDVHKYIPELETGDRLVTIRRLLNHTSGIRSISRIKEAMAPRSLDISQERIIRFINNEPFDFEPGEKFLYNNSGIWLLGVIIERLTGQTYGDYIAKNIFTPLGMDGSYYDSYKRVIPHRARGYVFVNGAFVHGEPNSPTRPFAAGALLSTTLDLVNWQRALFSYKVVSKASLQKMITPEHLNDGKVLPYGFGLFVSEFHGHRKIAHGGGQIGFSAYLSHYPDEGVIIAILANTQGSRMSPVRLAKIEQQIAELVLSQ